MVSSTLPELLDEAAALEFIDAGVPAVAGLRTGLACAAALDAPRGGPGPPPRDRGGARGARAPPRRAAVGNGRRWLAEHEAKELLRSAGLPVVEGRLVDGEDDAVVALSELGGHVAVKLSAPSVQHKADIGALVLGVATEEAVRAAHRRLAALGVEERGVLVERMAPPGAELLVAARADAVVPCLVVARRRRMDRAARRRRDRAAPGIARARRGGDPRPARRAAAHRGPRPAAASTWPRRRGWPPPPASCCSRAGSSCSSSIPCSSTSGAPRRSTPWPRCRLRPRAIPPARA